MRKPVIVCDCQYAKNLSCSALITNSTMTDNISTTGSYIGKSAPFIEHIFGESDDQLFSKINTNSLHILQQYLPDRSTLNYSLRPRRHNKTLITKTSDLNDREFIIRNIYKDLY